MFTLRWVVTATLTCLVCGCDVKVRDLTPPEYPASNSIGMYEIRAGVQTGALVNTSSVFLFAFAADQRIELTPNREGTEYSGLLSVRCRSSFPLQLLAVWKLQGLVTRQERVPPAPRTIRLVPGAPARDTVIPTAPPRTKPPKGGWTGAVSFNFGTAPVTQITAARIEPLGSTPADVAAAKPITVADALPLDARCGTPTDLHLSSNAPAARGTLIVDTNDPALPHAQVRVEFSPPM
jgi:hypothetical protein